VLVDGDPNTESGRVAAFFDMDRTALRPNTGTLYLSHAFRHGWLRKRDLLLGAWWAVLYKLTILDTEMAARRASKTAEGQDERALEKFCRDWIEDEILVQVSPTARRVIELHRQRGDRLVLLTASTSFTAEPVGEHLQMDHILCTRLESVNGELTGRLVEPPCVGSGKVAWAERLAAEEGLDLSRSTFYTDSIHDRPMLERVGFPVVVNPDFRLARSARKHGWRVERWR